MEFEFHSFLNLSFKKELEDIFFFNEEQSLVYSKIGKAIDKYGNPRIIENNKKIRIGLEKLEDCQNLILLGNANGIKKVLGVLLHLRISEDMAEIVHFAFDKTIIDDDNIIFLKMMKEITRIYKCIKGVQKIFITYTEVKLKIN